MDDYLLDKRRVRKAFNRAANKYDDFAILQHEICGRMLERLDYIKQKPVSVLDAGSGTGFGMRELSQRYPEAHLIALDMAICMLQVSRSSVGWWHKLFERKRYSYVCGDIEDLPLVKNCIELVWSNLALQWCNDLPVTFRELYRVMKVDGLIMFSTFGPDTLKELRSAFQGIDGYRHVNRFADMHDIGDMLKSAGFAAPVMDMEMITLTYHDLKGVMHDLRSIGAHNATAGRGLGMMGKDSWLALQRNYEKFRQNGKLPATFEVVYGHAWKPERKLQVTAEGAHIIRTPFKL